jgi:hypothetical protein
MAGLVPAIHDFLAAARQDVDTCDKRGHDAAKDYASTGNSIYDHR